MIGTKKKKGLAIFYAGTRLGRGGPRTLLSDGKGGQTNMIGTKKEKDLANNSKTSVHNDDNGLN
jgi:hypothetical protein